MPFAYRRTRLIRGQRQPSTDAYLMACPARETGLLPKPSEIPIPRCREAGNDPVNATDPSGMLTLPCPAWSLLAVPVWVRAKCR